MYRIDFAMDRGHEMIVDRDNGIRREELEEVELNMLRSNRIPHLLPLTWFELDGRVTFRYTLSGRRMLSHRLAVQSLTMEQFYMMLLGVVEALDECRHYMLRPEGCLLDDQYLFIGEQWNDISMAYVPLKQPEQSNAGTANLLALVVRWTAHISAIHGAGLQRLLQLLNQSNWPLTELRMALLELGGHAIIAPMPHAP